MTGAPPIPSGIASMQRSGIRRIMDLALARPGSLRLELGEPDFPTPEHVVEAAARAMRDGRTRYTATIGLPDLREALAVKAAERNGIAAEPDRVLVSSGAVQGIYAALVSLVEPGDRILLPAPGWPNYRMMAAMLRAEGVEYPLDPDAGFAPDLEALERLVDERTRVIVLNSPSNPLGAVHDAATVRALLDFARRHDLWVVSDECYDELVYDGTAVSPAALDTDDRVISVFSFSKTYAMTGWRIGYAVLPERLRGVVANPHEAMMSCVAESTQLAALAALTGPQDAVAAMRDAYRRRRDLALDVLTGHGVPAFRPSGAFYLWIDLAGVPGSSTSVAERLVAERDVALAPGDAFGAAPAQALRMSIATSDAIIAEAADRLGTALADWRS